MLLRLRFALPAVSLCSFAADPVRFALLGDRTGETQPGVYERIWKQVRTENPLFAVAVGDSIQGMNDAAAEQQWTEVRATVTAAWWPKLYLTPGNHDIWSAASEAVYEKQSGRPRHYSFDKGGIAHFTMLDNSRADRLTAGELQFLEADLQAHAKEQSAKFIVMHRPSWLFQVLLRNPDFPLHKLAKQYGVRYVIAGHVHQMMYAELEGIHYVSMPSAGGHLRGSKQYQDGWFFGHAMVTVRSASDITVEILELEAGRRTRPEDWGVAGLVKREP